MILQMSDFNNSKFGRFGNQLFKYFFLKIAAQELGCELRHPDWLGRLVFDTPMTPAVELQPDAEMVIQPPLDHTMEIEDALQFIRDKKASGTRALEVKGYFQFHSSMFEKYRALFFKTFQISSSITAQLDLALNQFNVDQRNVICVHIRRGDYLKYGDHHFFWSPSVEEILTSIKSMPQTNWPGAMVYVCSDDLAHCKEVFDRSGVPYFTHENLFVDTDPTHQLTIDFAMLCTAGANVISNSSFSFFASMVNQNAKSFFRPSAQDHSLVPFKPWNSPVLLSKD